MALTRRNDRGLEVTLDGLARLIGEHGSGQQQNT
jgi:hypothetical protein